MLRWSGELGGGLWRQVGELSTRWSRLRSRFADFAKFSWSRTMGPSPKSGCKGSCGRRSHVQKAFRL